MPIKIKTTKVPGKDYFMTVYSDEGWYFSTEGTADTAVPLTELESDPKERAHMNRVVKSFSEGYTHTNVEWRDHK